MSTLIWFFGVSLILVVVMISYRAYEVMRNKRIISDTLRQKADNFVLSITGRFVSLLKVLGSRIRGLLSRIPHRLYDSMHLVWSRFAYKVDTYFDRLRGRRGASQRGAVSLYWRQMGDEKMGRENSQ